MLFPFLTQRSRSERMSAPREVELEKTTETRKHGVKKEKDIEIVAVLPPAAPQRSPSLFLLRVSVSPWFFSSRSEKMTS
jgi:hypothetical protein